MRNRTMACPLDEGLTIVEGDEERLPLHFHWIGLRPSSPPKR
jgi:hypothetical protein